jgi:hypothetical protein
MNYHKKITKENGDTLSIICKKGSLGGKIGLFETLVFFANGTHGKETGFQTFEQVAETIKEFLKS